MNNLLEQHPDIFMAKKEIHYFGKDLHMKQPRLTVEEYLDFFSAGSGKKRWGESSVWYLFSSTAAEEIRSFNREARIIIMLRNPVEMMPALHNQNIFDANENIIDFERAVAVVDDRKRGMLLPPNLEHLSCLLYTDVPRYASQVERYLNVFGKERVQVIIYDDFKKDNIKIYKDVLHFLGIDEGFVPATGIVNPSKEIESMLLHRLIKHPPEQLRKLFRAVLPWRSVRHQMMDRFSNWNARERGFRHPSEAFCRKLKDEYKDEIVKLSRLLDRDLAFWIE